jgi:hypothetical protein
MSGYFKTIISLLRVFQNVCAEKCEHMMQAKHSSTGSCKTVVSLYHAPAAMGMVFIKLQRPILTAEEGRANEPVFLRDPY